MDVISLSYQDLLKLNVDTPRYCNVYMKGSVIYCKWLHVFCVAAILIAGFATVF